MNVVYVNLEPEQVNSKYFVDFVLVDKQNKNKLSIHSQEFTEETDAIYCIEELKKQVLPECQYYMK